MATHTAHVIVLGNEKGGSGKSTVALHLAIGLMQLGFRTTVADFDERQRSLFRYLENRRAFMSDAALALPCPRIYELPPAIESRHRQGRVEAIDGELRELCRNTDFLIIDTPGSVTDVARLAHSFADTLVTPMNDSLIDLDVLARIGKGAIVEAPSQYSYLVLEQRRQRLRDYGAGTDWIVLRNRIAPIASTNNQRIGHVLQALSPKLGFRIAPGVSERVIYRELFLTGATVLDPIDLIAGFRLTISHVAARMEVRQLLESLWLPQLAAQMAG
jgi:chromosome partitioning protein